MNLPYHILTRIVAVALLCLLANAVFVLHSSDQEAQQVTRNIAGSLAKQLQFQLLLRVNAGFDKADQLPDFSLWKETASVPGLCVRFVATGTRQAHSLCNGAEQSVAEAPDSFGSLYRLFFSPGLEITQIIVFKNRDYGVLTVTPSAETAIAKAWENIRRLLGLSVTTVTAVCWLVYLSIRRALHPAQTLVAGLGNLEQGRLAYRLPAFELNEWQRIALAINQLAATQQQLLSERQTLAVQLMNLQEEERRYLARELHDELGQCLAAINAINAAIAQTAAQQCPELLAETDQIGRITQHVLDNMRGLLVRLRPVELDGPGLAGSLDGLLDSWNRHGGKTCYRLNIIGDCATLPETLAIALFRIIQECLTNIAKHAAASQAEVHLKIGDDVVLTVTDDGIAKQLPFTRHKGIGLLGIRERAGSLDGQLALNIVQPHGLKVEVRLPIMPITGVQA